MYAYIKFVVHYSLIKIYVITYIVYLYKLYVSKRHFHTLIVVVDSTNAETMRTTVQHIMWP